MLTLPEALDAVYAIDQIVHKPTSKTAHKTANDHYQADFDAIRHICAEVRRKASELT